MSRRTWGTWRPGNGADEGISGRGRHANTRNSEPCGSGGGACGGGAPCAGHEPERGPPQGRSRPGYPPRRPGGGLADDGRILGLWHDARRRPQDRRGSAPDQELSRRCRVRFSGDALGCDTRWRDGAAARNPGREWKIRMERDRQDRRRTSRVGERRSRDGRRNRSAPAALDDPFRRVQGRRRRRREDEGHGRGSCWSF